MENIHTFSTDGSDTWYPLYACRLLKVKHHLHSIYEKSNIERRAIQYMKDRTECFDDYFPCKEKSRLIHFRNWLSFS